jgi:hypothetical protein
MAEMTQPAPAARPSVPPCSSPAVAVSLHLPPSLCSRLLPLWQEGLWLRVATPGRSIAAILRRQLGVAPEYLERRLQTIFLNGKPVDDVEQTLVAPGDCLALSAAMPGLVGATFRKKGLIASFRAGITLRQTSSPWTSGPCWMRLKLFNLLAQEWGPGLLARGVWLAKKDFYLFLQRQGEDFWSRSRVFLDGRNLSAPDLPALPWAAAAELIYLQVHPEVDRVSDQDSFREDTRHV